MLLSAESQERKLAGDTSNTTWPFAHLIPHAYGVILADPAWTFKTWSVKGQGKSASRHYPVLTLEEIKALPVADLAAKDCALVLWFTQTMVEQALAVMRAWGFTPKTLGAWAKRSRTGNGWQFGTGYLLRSAAEFFLIGTRGNPRVRARDVRNLIVAPVREHSRKPDEIHRNIERMFSDVPRCELFARNIVAGWDCWGEEIPR